MGYISLEQARVLAIRHARDNTDFYGPRYAGINLVWEVISEEDGEDYYDIRLSFRPAGRFRGEPGVEQFVIDKLGNIEYRQILDEPTGLDLPELPTASPKSHAARDSLLSRLLLRFRRPTTPATLGPPADPTPPPAPASTPAPTPSMRGTQVPRSETISNSHYVIRVGDRVRHQRFGEGVVLEVDEPNHNGLIEWDSHRVTRTTRLLTQTQSHVKLSSLARLPR